VLAEIGAEAADILSSEAYQAALGAASIMGMNNVFYRGRGFLDGKYDDLRPGLRMNIIANPGVDKANFELWSFAVSSINGCSHCVTAHEHTLREAGVDREAILEALKVAAIVTGGRTGDHHCPNVGDRRIGPVRRLRVCGLPRRRSTAPAALQRACRHRTESRTWSFRCDAGRRKRADTVRGP